MGTLEDERSLLEDGLIQSGHSGLYTGDGSVDINGKPVLKQNTGNWKACYFILGTECCERLAFYGISTNLVTYLTNKLHEGNVSAAKHATIWQGTCYLTPLLGATLADAYLGRYWTIAAFSMIYFLGMCALILSASVPALRPAECTGSVCPSATLAQQAVFLFGLYLVALGTGGIKPCVSPFGADQFDDTDSMERMKKGSFFNWFYFSIYIGILMSSTLIVWIEDNVGWGPGFGVLALFVGIAIAGFISGTPRYRFQTPGESPITRMCQVLVASCRKWNLKVPSDGSVLFETREKSSVIEGSYEVNHTATLKFLDKAAVISDAEISSGDFSNPWRLCTVTQVEELKTLIHLLPIWASGIFISTVYIQVSTMFVEQGMMMDRTFGFLTIPSASLLTFDVISVLFLLPIYDSLFVPMARKFTGEEKGITVLQRMGIGLFISVLCMAAAAVIEITRLRLAKELDLVDKKVAVPLSILWQIPQYILMGTAEIFTYVGQLEFFYEQSPDGLQSLCTSLCLCTISLGYYLNSFILTIVTYFTTEGGNVGWIPDNLNEGHLDYFFWLLAGLSVLNMLVYMVCAKKFKQKKSFQGRNHS
ncbi:protein NRT1/ PTR FAMILY 8.3-like isoform X2 [Morus notabilis]|uniref:protein NRT1/ PTR FAMILY 8.3-like isoform X2 n=1 Tax=Morus notabilis TaxID=981085 RepID=UPI000CED1EC3|nr:protein NRT1/ PTR FAMILY 8.3-like isoform X2 [Morus notabilis]